MSTDFIPGDEDRSKAILKKALERTRKRELKWTERTGRPFAYEVDLPHGNIEIGTEDNDGVAPYDFQIWSTKGPIELVYQLNSRHLAGFPELQELWTLVHRQLRGIDQVLDDIFDDLNE